MCLPKLLDTFFFFIILRTVFLMKDQATDSSRTKNIEIICKMSQLHNQMNDLIEIINYCYAVPVSL